MLDGSFVESVARVDHEFRSALDQGWRERLAKAESGALLPVLDNVVAILRHAPEWRGVIGFDEFSGQVNKLRAPPFDRGEVGEWSDLDDSRLELWLAENFALRKLRSETIFKGVMLAADANRYHAVRDYLNALAWDGKARLAGLCWDYFAANNCEATPYLEGVACKWMVGAVARVYRPGVKMDNVLILEGDQGQQKSSALKVLFSPWFTDAAFDIGSTDGYQIIRGMWCVELAELDGFNRVDSSRAKGFFTREVDRYRNPYGRKPVNVPRQGVFAGSVNHGVYLKDETGNRRYWPVAVGSISLKQLALDRDQLWAEAVTMYRDGYEWWVKASDRRVYELEQDDRYIGDAYEQRIRDWLDGFSGGHDGKVNTVSMGDLLGKALHLDAGKWTLPEQQRVGRIMARISRNPADISRPFWQRKRVGGSDQRERVWVRDEELS